MLSVQGQTDFNLLDDPLARVAAVDESGGQIGGKITENRPAQEEVP
jgi:hypothetical protein